MCLRMNMTGLFTDRQCNPCTASQAQYKDSVSKINCLFIWVEPGVTVNGVSRPCLWMFPLKLIKMLPRQGRCYKNAKNTQKKLSIVHAFSIMFELSIWLCQVWYPFLCSPLLAWKHLIEIKAFMVSGQIAINPGCRCSVARPTLASRGEAGLNPGLEWDITCFNVARLSEKRPLWNDFHRRVSLYLSPAVFHPFAT